MNDSGEKTDQQAKIKMKIEETSSCLFSTPFDSHSPPFSSPYLHSPYLEKDLLLSPQETETNELSIKEEFPCQNHCDELFPRKYSFDQDSLSSDLNDTSLSPEERHDGTKDIMSRSYKTSVSFPNQRIKIEEETTENCQFLKNDYQKPSQGSSSPTIISDLSNIKKVPPLVSNTEQDKIKDVETNFKDNLNVTIKIENTSDDERILPRNFEPDEIKQPKTPEKGPKIDSIATQKIAHVRPIQNVDHFNTQQNKSDKLSIQVDRVYSLKQHPSIEKSMMVPHATLTTSEYHQRCYSNSKTIRYNMMKARMPQPHLINTNPRNSTYIQPNSAHRMRPVRDGFPPERQYISSPGKPPHRQTLPYKDITHEKQHINTSVHPSLIHSLPASNVVNHHMPNRLPIYGNTPNQAQARRELFAVSLDNFVPISTDNSILNSIKSQSSHMPGSITIPNRDHNQIMRAPFVNNSRKLNYVNRMNEMRSMSHRYATEFITSKSRINETNLGTNYAPQTRGELLTIPRESSIESAVRDAMMNSMKNKGCTKINNSFKTSATKTSSRRESIDDQLCQNFSSLTHHDSNKYASISQSNGEFLITSVIGSSHLVQKDNVIAVTSVTLHTESYVKEVFPASVTQTTPPIEHAQLDMIRLWEQYQHNGYTQAEAKLKQLNEYAEEPQNNSLKPYVCNICHKSFSKRSILNAHKVNHMGKRPFACNLCDKTFKVKGNLKIHQLIHAGIKPYMCDICGKRFTQSCNLTTHRVTHTGRKAFSCHLCFKRFTVKGSLKIHLLTHSGERRFTCDLCGKKFTQNSSLTTHKLIHSGTKPYKCELCDKSFGLKGNLKTHMLIHTGAKPYTCELCEKSFGTRHNLKTHQLTHTGEKPFSCDICHKRFTHRISLKSHRLGKHCLK